MLQLYNAILPFGRLAARIVATRNPKMREGLEGRRDALQRLQALGARLRGRCIWIHTTSVGEYEQARPIVALLLRERPDLEIIHTFFSPSGFNYAQRLGESKHLEYLPEDTAGRMARALDALRPRALVIVKFDLWPNLVVQAQARNVPVLLVDATLHEKSLRSRWPAKRLYREIYARLQVISTVSEKDAARFRRVVPEHPRIVVDGDTRFDQVMYRRQHAHRTAIPRALQGRRPFTFIAGSTWGVDEARILPAWTAFLRSTPEVPARMLLVPHEPTAEHVAGLERQLHDSDLRTQRYSQLTQDAARDGLDSIDVLLVDRVGTLAELYAHADLAYVGGAFSSGVHNVMEPAIMRLPILFGPGYHNSPEAEMLLEADAAGVIRSAADLERRLRALAADELSRSSMGGRARAFVESNQGASERCVQRILACLESPTARTEEHA